MKIKLILIILFLNIIICAEPIDYPLQEQRTWDDLAKGYLFQGEAVSVVLNSGSITDWDYNPNGAWKNYAYVAGMSFMVGLPGKDDLGNMHPWALRPNPNNPDSLVYWGPTVSESWLDRTTDKVFSNFIPSEGNYSSGITVGTLYGDELDYVDSDDQTPMLATSSEPITWPFDENGNSFWPGWLNPSGDFFSDQDVYLTFSDKEWSYPIDGELGYHNQGYPTDIKVEMIASSYEAEELEDVLIFRVKLTNESQYNYIDLYTGFYFDVDALCGDLNGYNSGLHTNADDMLGFNEELDIVYIYDYDDQSGGIYGDELGYSGIMYIEDDQNKGLTGLRYFDWYVRPAVVQDESSGGCNAGSLNCPVSDDMEAIQYALLSNDIYYPNQPFSDWEWRNIESGSNPNQSFYHEAYFHPDPDTGHDPHFDSIEAIYNSSYFQDGEDGLDVVTFMSSGPYDILSGESIELSFGLVFGEDEADLLSNAQIIKDTPLSNTDRNHFAPLAFKLHANYPNPFNPATTISFEIPNYEFVSIKIYDLNGHLITTLTENYFNPGMHKFVWNAKNVSSGKYIVNLKSENYTRSQIVTLIK